jgi:hypothetical protein
MIAFLIGVSFQDGSGSIAGVLSADEAGSCASADTGRSIGNAGRAAIADSIARRLTAETVLLGFIFASLIELGLAAKMRPDIA